MSHNPNQHEQQAPPTGRETLSVSQHADTKDVGITTNTSKRERNRAQKPTYAHDVYKRRFKHFRTLRLLSLLVGGSILLLLILGMRQLYTMVFLTIENTEHVFLITEKRRTHTIDFNTLEQVRSSWNQKYSSSASSTEGTPSLFPEPIEDITVDAQ